MKKILQVIQKAEAAPTPKNAVVELIVFHVPQKNPRILSAHFPDQPPTVPSNVVVVNVSNNVGVMVPQRVRATPTQRPDVFDLMTDPKRPLKRRKGC